MKIKLVVCDVDGTLVEGVKPLEDHTRARITSLQSHGVAFSLATGRTIGQTVPLIEALGITVPCVLCNGAEVATPDKRIHAARFPAAPLREALERSAAMGMTVFLCRGDPYPDVVMAETDFLRRRDSKLPAQPPQDHEWADLQLQKITIIDDGHRVEEVCRTLTPQPGIDIVYYGRGGMEIMPRSCNKASGVRVLADYLGISMSEVLAIGNDYNDIEMLRECGVGVVVRNAPDPVKQQAACTVTQGEFADGVLEAINRFCN